MGDKLSSPKIKKTTTSLHFTMASLSTSVTSATSAANVQNMPENYHGIVKWFDARKGYGFVTPIGSGDDATGRGADIFVHILDLHPKNCTTPTLFTGEYVQYQLVPTADNSGRFKAHNVTGIYGHTLLCDHGKVTFKAYSRVGFGEGEDQVEGSGEDEDEEDEEDEEDDEGGGRWESKNTPHTYIKF